ncbi:MAG: EAL domain-containing protein [Halieaceae bacterium]|nr:EAL domain-containing protein [Halieaceae bacterium]
MMELLGNSRSRPLLLIADDDKGTRLILQHVFTKDGFDVCLAENGAEAIDKYAERRPDAVLLDVQMPYMDGYQVCELIRDREREVKTPIVMITGQNDIESISRAYDLGATDFISKPFDKNTLPFRMRHVLRAHSEHNSLHGLMHGIPDAIAVLDDTGDAIDFMNANRLFRDVENADMLELFKRGHRLPRGFMDKVRECVRRTLQTDEVQELEFQIANSQRHFEARIIRRDAYSALAIIRDVTERQRSEQKIQELAYSDTLTGLPNREQFKKILATAIRRADATGTSAALLYLDLDRFKRINDTFGHSVGDALLCAVAERLRTSIRKSTRGESSIPGGTEISRLGGDEFTIVVPELSDKSHIESLCSRIQRTLTTPFVCEGHQIVVSPSIGVAIYPEHGDDEQELLMRADTAMYEAKGEGANNARVYHESMNARSLELLALESEMNRAIERNELELHYQPKIDIREWRLVGLEALIRWKHHERGWISPVDFIPIAEDTGQIIDIGRWVLQEACRQLGEWREGPAAGLQIAVNISSQQFTHDDLQRSVMEAVWENRVGPRMLELEITESVLVGNVDETIDLLTALKTSGVSVAIDDFGTGYSSLSYLKRFPVDKLKIDRTFIRDLHRNPDDAAICSAILAMGRQLGLAVVAEGVENEEQLQFLDERECDQVQGYYFGKPMPAHALPDFLHDVLNPHLAELKRNSRAAP